MSAQLGEMRGFVLAEEQVSYTANGIVVVLRYKTEFAKGTAQEQFAWLVKGDQSLLYNYTLNVPIQY